MPGWQWVLRTTVDREGRVAENRVKRSWIRVTVVRYRQRGLKDTEDLGGTAAMLGRAKQAGEWRR